MNDIFDTLNEVKIYTDNQGTLKELSIDGVIIEYVTGLTIEVGKASEDFGSEITIKFRCKAEMFNAIPLKLKD